MAELRIDVLGPPVITCDGRTVDLRGRQLDLLIRLVTAGTALSTERLRGDVWGAASSNDGPVRVALTRLRQLLGPDVVERVPGGYRLADAAVDARRFDVLVSRARDRGTALDARIAIYDEALALWRGAAFDGVAERFEWLDAAAAHLDELREQAIDERFELRSLVEDPGWLVPELVTELDRRPLREHRVELLATALYRSQRQSDALGVIADARRALADTLGLAPGPSLDDLERRILVHDPSLSATPRTITTSVRPDIESHLRAATSLVRAGAYAEALELIDRADDMARSSGDRRSRAESLLARARHASMSGTADPRPILHEARALARQLRDGPLLAAIAVAGFGQGAPVDLHAGFVELMEPLELLPSSAPERVDLLCAAAAMVGVGAGSGAGGALLGAAEEAHSIHGSPRTAAVLAATRCIVAAGAGGAPGEVERRATEALEFARTSNDPGLAVVVAHALMRSRYVRGDLDGVDELLAPLLDAGRSALFPFAIARVALCRAMHAIARGELDRAAQLVDEAADVGHRLGTLNTRRAVAGQRALLLHELDRLDEMIDELEVHAADGAGHRTTFRALLALADPDRPSPIELADEVADGATLPPFVAIGALVADARGDEALARWCRDRLMAMDDSVLSSGLGSLLLGFTPHARGLASAVLGRSDGAIADLEQALELTRPTGAALWTDHARTDLARLLTERGGPGDHERAGRLADEVLAGDAVRASPRLERRVRSVRSGPASASRSRSA